VICMAPKPSRCTVIFPAILKLSDMTPPWRA
jgi:hypothetical protein